MAKRWLTERSITLESEKVNIIVATPNDFTVNGVPFGTSITLAPIGAAPNANAATIVGSVLNLQPASAAFGGVVTTGAQTFAGVKNFQNGIQLAGGSTLSSATQFLSGACVPTLNVGAITASAGGAFYQISDFNGVRSLTFGSFQVSAFTLAPFQLIYNTGNLIPVQYRPSSDLFFTVPGLDNTVAAVMKLGILADGRILLEKLDNTAFTATFGVLGSCVSYFF